VGREGTERGLGVGEGEDGRGVDVGVRSEGEWAPWQEREEKKWDGHRAGRRGGEELGRAKCAGRSWGRKDSGKKRVRRKWG